MTDPNERGLLRNLGTLTRQSTRRSVQPYRTPTDKVVLSRIRSNSRHRNSGILFAKDTLGVMPSAQTIPSNHAPTIAHVAATAGVSHQTVSRVLNDHPSVSPQTRQRVRDAIDALGYRPNMAARALATGSSQLIGVMSSSDMPTGRKSPLFALERAAQAAGYWVIAASVPDNDPERASSVIHHFQDHGVISTIALARTEMSLQATLEALGDSRTAVLVTPEAVRSGHFSADLDQANGARSLMRLLRGLGHRRIAHIRGPVGSLHADHRTAVWARELPAGQTADELCVTGDWSAESGYCATMQLLSLDELPTAIFAANDVMAIGALRALHERGLVVPQDISVVGYDNLNGSDCLIPPLTTVSQDMDALGAAAFALAREAILGMPPRSVTIPTQLIVRASTGVARAL
jgi:DNA-binding LacI/PurR family transcriptional regulator